jgi:hypothetical protein
VRSGSPAALLVLEVDLQGSSCNGLGVSCNCEETQEVLVASPSGCSIERGQIVVGIGAEWFLRSAFSACARWVTEQSQVHVEWLKKWCRTCGVVLIVLAVDQQQCD